MGNKKAKWAENQKRTSIPDKVIGKCKRNRRYISDIKIVSHAI